LFLLLFIGACSDTADDDGPDTTQADTSQADTNVNPGDASENDAVEGPDSDAIVGAWTRVAGPPYDGPVFLTVTASGYEVEFTGGPPAEVSGTYTVSGNQITVSDVSGQFACEAGDGVFSFSLSGDDLVVATVSDDCPERADFFSATWMPSE